MINADRQPHDEARIFTEKAFKRISRRELLKLSPILAASAVLIPKFRDPLLEAGLGLSDSAAHFLFRKSHLAQTFADREVTPLDKFPYNYYDVLDPEVDLKTWRLRVSGLVRRPGEYTLAQIQALPKFVQNTRHVCIEGWSV